MRTLSLRALAVIGFGIALGPRLYAAAPFETLLQKVPEGANVLMVVNVEQVLQSDYARSHDTQKKLAEAFEQRSILIPPNATQFVTVAQYDLEHFTRTWEAAVMGLKTPLNLYHVATNTQRSVEMIGGMEGIGGKKVFLLNLGDNLLGVFVPSNRQQVARWAQRLKQTSSPLSDYLAKIGSYGDTAKTDIILAIDLADAMPEKFVADRLRKNDVLQGRNVDIDKLAKLIAGTRGVRLGIKIGAKNNAMLVVDLADDPAIMADFAKPLLLSVLKNTGIMLDEMEDWKPAIAKQSFSLQGELSAESLRLLMGIVELPPETISALNAKGAPQPTAPSKSNGNSDDSLQRDTSRKYYQEVQKQLDSLRLRKDAKTLGQRAAWIDMTARGIDRMSILNVDDELLDYGATLSTELRQMVAALQGVGIQSGAAQAQIYGSDSPYYDDGFNVSGARRAVKAEATAAGATSARDISRLIADQSAAIRRKMTQKYKVDF